MPYILLLLACAFQQYASAQVAFTLGSNAGSPGSTVRLNLSVESTGTVPAALQWSLRYAPGDITSINVIAGTAALAADKIVMCGGPAAPLTVTCIIYGYNQNPIANGVAAFLDVVIAPTASPATTIAMFGAVAASPDGDSLAASVAGNSIAIIQQCGYVLSSPSASVGGTAGSGSINVTASGPGCPWTAASDDAWINISSVGFTTGNGTVSFSYSANLNSSARTGTIRIAGMNFIVSQAAAGCSFSLSNTIFTTGGAGGGASVNVTANGSNCAWTAASRASWIVLTSGPGGTGSGSVNFQVLANPGPAARSSTATIAGVIVTVNQSGTQTGAQTSGLRFVPLDPCRVMETRSEYNFQGRGGVFGPPALTHGEIRTLTPPQSTVCQIPATAKAYMLNVTLVPRGSVDFVTLWPAGEARPTFWTVRSPDGQIVANAAIVKTGVNGGISVFASDNTDLLIDVSGYFTDSANEPAYTYYPLTPCRVVDTRALYRLAGPFGPPTLNAGERRTFAFPAATQYCQIPTEARAFSVTLTVSPPGPLQFLTAWPAGGAQPIVSSLNSPAGRILANSAIITAGAAGSVDFYVFNQSDLIVDITGYFAPDDGLNGLFYFPVTQCRSSDSIIESETAISVVIPSVGCGVPASAQGYAASVTAIPNGSPMPYLTLYPTGQPRPVASTLNAFEGQTITNATILPSGVNAAIDIYAYRRTQVVLEISGYFGR